ncbi:hypothetical protein LZ31DRAFT_115136 [Colletotrichum somersetense]|nr:hypothetical protein LZ31DRAFT_115136 [Colletotrichum somersetense]
MDQHPHIRWEGVTSDRIKALRSHASFFGIAMDAPQRSTSWPGVSTCYSHGSQSARNAQPALPRNPFSRPPDVLGVISETQNIKEYHSFQMSCYTLSPTVKAVSGSAAPNINPQCDAMPSPPSRLLSVLPTVLAMVDDAKRGLRTVSTNVMSVKHYTCDKIAIWWLSSRGFRLRLLRLVASLFAILMSVTLIQSSRTMSPQAYTLVHMCRSWSVYQGSSDTAEFSYESASQPHHEWRLD